MLGSSSTDIRLTGPVRGVGHGRVLRTPARIGRQVTADGLVPWGILFDADDS
ncbi:hypothetical protein AB4212_69915 [Streptomyces sp. 2MCAF27]